jgi:hypothetical protein
VQNLRSPIPVGKEFCVRQPNISILWLPAVLWLAACSDTTQPLHSSSPLGPSIVSLNPDGSSLKVQAPTDLAPNGAGVGVTRPTLSFANAAGEFVVVGLAYDVEVQNRDGGVVYARTIGESPGLSSHTLDSELRRGETYWWRARGRLGDETGPWSDFATFAVSPSAVSGAGPGPGPGPGPDAPLPFPVPAECGPGGPGDRSACVAAMVGVSPWWPECAGGSGVGCHRFTRSVAAALEVHDGNWGLISKNPGEQQCSWDFCGPGDGSGYGEDIVAYHTGGGDWIGFDVVIGAGGSGASPQWAQVGGRRPGNDWRPVPPFP